MSSWFVFSLCLLRLFCLGTGFVGGGLAQTQLNCKIVEELPRGGPQRGKEWRCALHFVSARVAISSRREGERSPQGSQITGGHADDAGVGAVVVCDEDQPVAQASTGETVAEEAGDGLEQGRTEWLFVEACPPLLTLLHHQSYAQVAEVRSIAEMADTFEFDDGVGSVDSAVDPFADYQQPSSGFGFVDDEPPAPSSSSSDRVASFDEQVAPASPQQPSQQQSGSSGSVATTQQQQQLEDENSPLRVYQREQQQKLAEREKKSREEHDKVRAAARAEIDKFYEERRQKRDKAIKDNRAAQAETKKDESGAGASGWARAVALVDLNAGKTEGKDVSRMRKILLEAKHGALPLKSH